MIGVVFTLGSDIVEVRVIGHEVVFRTNEFGTRFVDISGLNFSKEGVIKDYPDLKDNVNWKLEAIKRFKNELSQLPGEKERMDYIVKDLKRFGYIPLYIQKAGFRPERYKE